MSALARVNLIVVSIYIRCGSRRDFGGADLSALTLATLRWRLQLCAGACDSALALATLRWRLQLGVALTLYGGSMAP
jgi:hypothetical protein